MSSSVWYILFVWEAISELTMRFKNSSSSRIRKASTYAHIASNGNVLNGAPPNSIPNLHRINPPVQNDWSTQIIFACSITATRLSLLLFYHRIFPMQRFRTIAILIGCVLIAWWLSFLLGIIFSCVPVQSFWDRSLDGRCIDENSFSYGITAAELATNVAMLVLPIPWLWSLNLPRSKKLALGGIFMLGSLYETNPGKCIAPQYCC